MNFASQQFNLLKQDAQYHQLLRSLYLICAVLSLVVSWGIFYQFLSSDGASITTFFQQAFQTPIATLVSSDLLISVSIFFTFAYQEIRRLNMPSHRLLLYVVGTFSVGICFALSLFLHHREDRLCYLHSQREANLEAGRG